MINMEEELEFVPDPECRMYTTREQYDDPNGFRMAFGMCDTRQDMCEGCVYNHLWRIKLE